MLWFRCKDKIVGEEHNFDIIVLGQEYAVRWFKANCIKEAVFVGSYEECQFVLGYIDGKIIKENDEVIDLRHINFSQTNKKVEEEKEEQHSEDDCMKLLKDNVGKFFTYEQWKEDARPQQEEKDVKIIRTKEDLAQVLNHYKRINGYKLKELANALDINFSSMWEYCNKKHLPSSKTNRDKIAKKLNVKFVIDM